jgi:hypothetical protein
MRLLPRRPWNAWKWAAAVVLVLTTLWFAPDAAGYVQGRIEASRALARGRAELRTIGLPRNPRGGFDPETGLVSQTLGCCVTGWTLGYRSGWNSVMRGAVARGDVDTSALRSKVTALDAMKARFAAEPGFTFNDDGTRVRDPSGRWELFADGARGLQIADAALPGVDHVYGYVRVDGATCVFADGGSTLCVRRDEGWRIGYETFDLERRITLQEFHEETGRPRPST